MLGIPNEVISQRIAPTLSLAPAFDNFPSECWYAVTCNAFFVIGSVGSHLKAEAEVALAFPRALKLLEALLGAANFIEVWNCWLECLNGLTVCSLVNCHHCLAAILGSLGLQTTGRPATRLLSLNSARAGLTYWDWEPFHVHRRSKRQEEGDRNRNTWQDQGNWYNRD